MSAVPPGYAFRGPGLDRSELLRDQPDELRRRWPGASVIVVDADGNARFPGSAEAPEALTGTAVSPDLPAAASFLGLVGDLAWFAVPHESLGDPLPGRLDLRSAAAQWPALETAVLAQARALLHWQQRNRHCGACGHPLALARAGWTA